MIIIQDISSKENSPCIVILCPFSARNKNSSSSTKHISSSPCTGFLRFLWCFSAQSQALSSMRLGWNMFRPSMISNGLNNRECTARTILYIMYAKGLVPMALPSQPCFRIPPYPSCQTGLSVHATLPLFQCNLHLVEGPVAFQKFGQLFT